MLPTPDDCIHLIRRAVGNSDDSALITVPVGALRTALLAMEDHAHCATDGDESLADLQKEHDAEMALIEFAADDLIAAVEEMLAVGDNQVTQKLNALKRML